MDLPEIKQIPHADEEAVRNLTYRMTELLKLLVARHIKENYKVIIQVMTYCKDHPEQQTFFLMNRCLWNAQTDDLLSIELETDRLKCLIAIYGLVA